MVGEYRRRRDAALSVLQGAANGPRVVPPDGGFYLFIQVGDVLPGDDNAGTTFAARLLEEFGVAVVPGAAFRTPGWVRASYAATLEDVVEGMRRILACRAAFNG